MCIFQVVNKSYFTETSISTVSQLRVFIHRSTFISQGVFAASLDCDPIIGCQGLGNIFQHAGLTCSVSRHVQVGIFAQERRWHRKEHLRLQLAHGCSHR